MSISGLLNILAERTLIACDASYFTNTTINVPRPSGDSDPTHLYKDDPLVPLLDSSPVLNGYRPVYPYVSLTQGYVVDQEFVHDPSGFKAVAFKNSATNDIILAFGGTDGTNGTDWKANIQTYGFSEWEARRVGILGYLNGLPRDPDTGELLVTVNFTGQSLGGALAQYAVYDWLKDSTNSTDASHVTLTTFNGLGGVYALSNPANEPDGYNPSVLAGLSSAANFVVQGDLASKLGGGFAAGSIYQLSYSPEQLNPVTGLPYEETLGLVDSHRIESGFYANLQSDGFASAQLIDAASYIIPSDRLAQPAALLGNLLNAKGAFVGSDFADFLAGLSAAAAIADPVQFDALYKAVLQSGRDTGDLNDIEYTALNILRFPTDLVLKAIGVAATPITLLGAGLADAFHLGLIGIQKAFLGVQQYLGLPTSQVPTPPTAVTSHEYEMKMLVYLSDVPGSTPASLALAQEFQALNVDPDALAQQLLSTNGSAWRTETLAYLRDQLPNPADKVQVNGLAVVFYDTLCATPDLDPSEVTLFAQERDAFILDTGSGFANAFQDFTQKITNVAFNLGQTISNFADIQLIDQAYAAELSDPRLASPIRTALEEAQAIVQRAGQTVVVQQGVGPNPFETAAFDPVAAPLATGTVKEKSVNTFTAYLPFQAGTGGQSVQLKLNGIGANTMMVLSGGQEFTPVNGMVTLVIPEGQKDVQFALRAQNLSTDVTVSLVAQLVEVVNGTPVATHQEHQEATITAVNTPAINYANGLPSDVWNGTEFDDLRDLLGLFNYEAHGNGGSDLIFSRAGNDQLYGDAGNDSLFGFVGHDQLYGGTGRDLLIADFRDDYVPGGGSSGPVAAQDVADGGAEDDVVAGGGGDDQLIGGTGNDHLWGDNLVEGDGAQPGDPESGLRGTYFFRVANTPGDDELDGGEGDDLLLGNLGDDVLLGGAGADKLFGDQVPGDSGAPVSFQETDGGADFLDGGDGNDLLQGDGGDDVLWGGAGHDQLYGDDRIAGAVTPGDDWLEGGAGDDLLVGGAGDDLLDGGTENDQLFGEEGDDVLDGGDGIDQLSGGIGSDDLYGGAGDDILAGHDGADTLLGEAGADQLDGGNDNDALFGGTGNDVLFGQAGDDYLDGEEDADELQGGAGNDILVGDVGNDRLFGDAGNDTLWGDEGDDILDGGAGNNLLLGGDGNDQLIGGSGMDELDGGAGNDVLIGGSGADTFIYDGQGQDVFTADVNDTLELTNGLAPDTIVASRSGNNLILTVDGLGNQLTMQSFFASSANQVSQIQFADGTVWDTATIVNQSRLIIGTNGNDAITAPDNLGYTIQGLGGNDTLVGRSGADTLEGGLGSDSLVGQDGQDVLAGGAGNNDQLEGGAGHDTYVYRIGDGLDVVVDTAVVGAGNSAQFGPGIVSADIQLMVNGSSVVVGTGDPTQGLLLGNTRRTNITGTHDIESFQTADGLVLTYADLLARGITINGTTGNDRLFGTSIKDRFVGGLGNDQLFGAVGDDRYVFHLGDGVDTVVDTATPTEGNEVLFGLGITSSMLRLSYAEDPLNSPTSRDVVIQVGSGGDQLWLTNLDLDNVAGPHAVETFHFADGTRLTYSQLVAQGFEIGGTAGNDVLAGTNVDDRFTGGTGNDRLEGKGGNDLYVFGRGAGQDTVLDRAGARDAIQFGADVLPSDVSVSRAGRDLVLSINGTADRLTVSEYFLAGALQVEEIRFADGTVWDAASLQTSVENRVGGTTGDDVLQGTAVDDLLAGFAGHDHLFGLAGDDLLDGGGDDDQLTGGEGNDLYIVDSMGDSVTEALDEGTDTVQSSVTFSLGANAENLELTGTASINGFGNEIDNTLTGNSATNVLTGGAGNDTYVIGAGDTVVEGLGDGIDTIQTTVGTMLGAYVENLILLGSAPIEGRGNDLDNVITGNGSVSILAGGAGNDTFVLKGFEQVQEAADAGIDTVETALSYRLEQNVENLTLLESDASLMNPLFDFFLASKINGSGNELDNVLTGNRGTNRLDGDLGADTMVGKAGNDTYVVDNIGDTVIEASAEGIDLIESAIDYALSDHVENLTLTGQAAVSGTGNALDNLLTGNTATNILDGGSGNDRLQGGGGADTYVFGRGYGLDEIFGGGTVQLGPGITPGGVEAGRYFHTGSFTPNGLVLGIIGTSDAVYLPGYFDAPNLVIRFDDGTIWDLATVTNLVNANPGFVGPDWKTLPIQREVATTISGTAGNDILQGTSGRDIFTSSNGADILIGGSGDDIYSIDSLTNDTIIEASGGGFDVITGDTSGTIALPNNVEAIRAIGAAITGNALDNLIIMVDSGSDSQSNSVVDGGGGNDMIVGGYVQLVTVDGSGSDILIGGDGNDTLIALGGRFNTTNGGASDFGDGDGAVNPVLASTIVRPNDVLVGGKGDDTYVIHHAGETIVENAGEGIDTVKSFVTYTLPDQVENLWLVPTNDAQSDSVIPPLNGTGNSLDNLLVGDEQRNVLSGGAGHDTLIGMGPTIEFTGSFVGSDDQVVDTLIGGFGNDTYLILGRSFDTNLPDTVVEAAEEGIDTVMSTISYALTDHVENLTLIGSGPLTATGNALNNTVTGNIGANTLIGGVGTDTLGGGEGDDTYRFELGDGLDTIDDSTAPGEGNRIQFGGGINQSALSFTRDEIARTLTIQVGSSGTDQLRLLNFDPTGVNGSLVVETLTFVDGSTVNLADLFPPITNHVPTVAIPLADQTVPEDAPFSFVVPSNTFADEDTGDTLTLSASLADGTILPAWLSFNAATATFTGTPNDAQVGRLDLKVTATDQDNLNVSDTFSLTVANVNEAPTVAAPLADQQAVEDVAFTFTVPGSTFADVDSGDVLTYSATLAGGVPLPSWLSFDPITRTFSGTPGNSNVGTLAVTVTATDAGNLSASTGFTLAIQNVNDAPTVAAPIADQTAAEDSAFTFAVPGTTFTDADLIHGDSLTYGAILADGSALPAWLSFNPSTRTFSGTPGVGNAGTLQIAVTATDSGSLNATDTFALSISGPLPKTLVGTAENDVLIGGRGDDTLSGLAGNDTLNGGQGHDLLDGGTGIDTMVGGTGNDTYLVDIAGDVVTELANEGTDTVQSSITYILGANVENLTLTGTANLNGTGNALDNILTGNGGTNGLTGGAGNDTYVVGVGDTVVENLNGGTDTVMSSVTWTLGSNLENLTLTGSANLNGTGSSANNVLVGNSGNNTLDGGSGNDTMDGGAGNDSLLGGSGDDQLLGGIGDDTLIAGSGNDALNGGEGIDTLDGGSGDDYLLGGAGNDTFTGGSGADQFTGGIGNDTLMGGSGNDLYNFSRGDGQDMINDFDPFTGNQDRALFDAMINPLDLVISRQANDLRLAIHGSSDQVTVQNWYLGTNNRIETLQAGNGQTLLSTQVDQLIQAMAGFTAQTGLTWDQAIDQRPQEVQAVLAASWQ